MAGCGAPDKNKPSEKTYKYDAVIQPADKGGAYVAFPYDVRAEFGKRRVKIHTTFDGEPYDGSVVNMGVKNPDGPVSYIFGIRKDIRAKIGKQPGDSEQVTIRERMAKMKENKYDDMPFFEKYSQMQRSVKGLEGAGEWNALKLMLPAFKGKRVLDLGCGFGWHCAYAAEQGAAAVTGIDISEKMLDKAKLLTNAYNIEYRRIPIEDYQYPENSFDIVLSSLAFHYVKSFHDICANVWRCLTPDGDFVFSVEHPVFTAGGSQKWVCDDAGNPLHWPVDDYFYEGQRAARFLEEDVTKYHRTMTAYISGLLRCGFEITGFCEPVPPDEMLGIPGMRDELRRPMMLIISAKKRRKQPKREEGEYHNE